MRSFRSDAWYAVRLLLKTPAVTVVAVLTLALGIGANVAIFGIMNALLLRSLPVRDPQQLVSLGGLDSQHPEHGTEISLAIADELRRRAHVFSSVLAWSGGGMETFEAHGASYPGSLDTVSGNYFAALGVPPYLGRVLTQEDAPLDGRRSAPVAVLSYGCWQRRFNGDERVIGQTIRVRGVPLTIVGVTPPHFTGLQLDAEPEATVPIGFTGRALNKREIFNYSVFARLKPGLRLSQARAEVEVLWPSLLQTTIPESYQGAQRLRFLTLRAEVQPATRGQSYLRERLEKPLFVLMALVGAVLLMACLNLAHLLLARAAARQHEFGIRVALGAERWSLVRLLLLEALLLSCSGAALALMVARGTAHFLVAGFWTGFVPLALDVSPDLRVLGFTVVLALGTGVLFGILPAWQMSRSDPARALSQGSRTTGGSAGRFRHTLLTAQVALSLVLLTGAMLFVRSLQNLRAVDPGYRRDHLLVLLITPQPGHEAIPHRTSYYHELVTRLRQLPGIEAVSFSNLGPVTGYEYKSSVSTAAGAASQAVRELAGPDFFHTMGIPIRAGRDFDWHDDEHAPRVAVLSESLAQALFANQNPLGNTLDGGVAPEQKGLRIIGVARNASFWKLDSRQPFAVYQPLLQEAQANWPRVLLRTRNDPRAIIRQAERTVASLGHHYSLRTETLEQRTDTTLVRERLLAQLASAFSLLALLLAAVGLYGALSYAVMRRTAEIGVRMAVGATRMDVLRMILAEVAKLMALGIVFALPAVWVGGKLLSGQLFGVSATDPAAWAVSSATLIVVAALAGYLPARRASRVDPLIALRHD